MFDFIHISSFDNKSDFREIGGSEQNYPSSRLFNSHCFTKLGRSVENGLSQIAATVESLSKIIFASLSSIKTKIGESASKVFSYFFPNERESSKPLQTSSNKTSELALRTLGMERQQPHTKEEEEVNDDEFFDCFETPAINLTSKEEIDHSGRSISNTLDENNEDELYYDCIEGTPLEESPETSICDQNKKNIIESSSTSRTSPSDPGEIKTLKKSTIEFTSQHQDLDTIPTESLAPSSIDFAIDQSIPHYSRKLVDLLNLIVSKPIDSLSQAKKTEKVGENITEYTFHLPTHKEFNKMVPSSILSKIPDLDYNNLSLFSKSMVICGSKLINIHSPKALSFVLSLDKKQETATLMFLSPNETLSVNLNFGPFGNYGAIHIHQIRYNQRKSGDLDSTVYFKEASENWPKTLPNLSDEDDDLSSAFNTIKYDLSTQTISEIWSSLGFLRN